MSDDGYKCMKCGGRFSDPDRCPKCDAGSELAAPAGSLSGLGSEIMIHQWEARASECEKTAEQFRTTTANMLASYLEKARAYRQCANDLRRQLAHEASRQPRENTQVSDDAKRHSLD